MTLLGQAPSRRGACCSFSFPSLLKNTLRAGVMNKAPVGHEPFVHRDAAPSAVTVGKVTFRRRTRRRWQRRVHKGILINPPTIVNAPPERMKKRRAERDKATSEEKDSASQPPVIPPVSPSVIPAVSSPCHTPSLPLCHTRSLPNLSYSQSPSWHTRSLPPLSFPQFLAGIHEPHLMLFTTDLRPLQRDISGK